MQFPIQPSYRAGAVPQTGIRTGHGDETKAPGRVRSTHPHRRAREAALPGPGWLHEIKHDGYRLLARKDGGTVRLFTRKANTWTERFPAIAAAAAALPSTAMALPVVASFDHLVGDRENAW